MNSRRTFLLGVALCLSFAVLGAIIVAFFSAPLEKSEVALNESLTVKAGEYRTRFFGYYSAYDNVVSFNVLNGTIESCGPQTEVLYLEWQAGRYTPNLTETDQGVFEYKGTQVQYPMIGAIHTRYLFFFNQDSYDKMIQWQITSYWYEPNAANLTIGAVLITAGLGAGLGLALMYALKTTRRR